MPLGDPQDSQVSKTTLRKSAMSYKLHEVDENAIRRTANIVGPSSASARALADLDERRAAGEDAALFLTHSSSIVVGPRIPMIPPTDHQEE